MNVSNVEEGTLEVALYAKKKGEGPDYRLETTLVEKRDGLLRFDAEKFLKDCGFDCRAVEKEEYDRYAFEFRHYTNSDDNKLSRAYASGAGCFTGLMPGWTVLRTPWNSCVAVVMQQQQADHHNYADRGILLSLLVKGYAKAELRKFSVNYPPPAPLPRKGYRLFGEFVIR